MRSVMLATTALVPLGIVAALANPQGPNVVGGGATVSGVGTSSVTVNQSSSRAIINWHSFNIGSGETTRFQQPDASSVALNRVTGGLGLSQLFGTLSANGRVFVVNPDGILVGRGAVIDTAGFLATTHDITNENFMAGRYHFNIPGRPDASIVNEGRINAHSQGFAALVAPGVRNSGTITARFGKIGLAAGNSFSLDFYGDQLITLAVGDSVSATVKDVATGQPLNALVKNEGKLKATGGRVELSAVAARTVVDSVINNTGVIEARSVGQRNGKIVLGGPTAATKVAGAPTQTVKVSGTLSTASRKGKGGTIQVTGEAIEIKAASFDASGATGGGKVLIGGDTGGGHLPVEAASIPQAALEAGAIPAATKVNIDAATTINASATSVGDGGKVIVWADGGTNFAGSISARGGDSGGSGGFVEVSGKQTLGYTGTTDLRAPRGSFGTLLLDPGNMTVSSVGVHGGFTGSDTANSTVINTTLNAALELGSVIVKTGTAAGFNVGDIIVSAQILWNAATTLTLSAYRNIQIDDTGVTGTIRNTGGGSLVLRADSTGTGTGTIVMPASTNAVRVDWTGSTGTVQTYYNPVTYTTPTNFALATANGRFQLASSSQLTSFMLVNTFANLQSLVDPGGGLGNYALGKDIDAGGGTLNPFAFTFTGVFDGQSKTISNVAVNGPAPFGSNSGTIKDLTLSNWTVNATANNQMLGLLVGTNNASGVVSNVKTGGTVNGGSFTGVIAGGIAGQNNGTISGNSMSSAGVTVGSGVSGGTNTAGGIAGVNTNLITGSSTSSAVTAGAFAIVGGGVGNNQGTVTGTSSTGSVNSTGASVIAGGLAGQNSGTINGNSTSSAAVTVGSGVAAAAGGAALAAAGSGGWNYAGGLAGINTGTVTNASASGAVVGGSNAFIGGLIGQNGNTGQTGGAGTVNLSSASGAVSSAGTRIAIGGLVGFNAAGAKITDSSATGNVTATGNVPAANCAGGSGGCESVSAGGLVGTNAGTILSSVFNTFATLATFASGAVSVGSNAVGGGLVGLNDGIIGDVGGSVGGGRATGAVTGAAGIAVANNSFDRNTILGGLVGINRGLINQSSATGAVGSAGVDRLTAGGFVGENSGFILNSTTAATSTVTAGNDSAAGGFVGMGDDMHNCAGCTLGDGSLFNNINIIALSNANGAVTVGSSSLAGGFAGAGSVIFDSHATGAVTGGGDSILGGFVGAHNPAGIIFDATATGSVTSTGPYSWVGGFAGFNAGWIFDASASGAVKGVSDSILGGFVAVNIGYIGSSSSSTSSSGAVTTTGGNNIIGGFAGLNLGTIDSVTTSSSIAAVGANIAGGLVGANATFTNVPAGSLPGSNFPTGTTTNSTSTGTVSSGPGSTTGDQVGTSSPSSLPKTPAVLANCDELMCTLFTSGLLQGQVRDNLVPDEVLAIPNLLPPVHLIERIQSLDALIKLTNLTPPAPPGTIQRSITSAPPGTPPRSLAPVLPSRPVCGAGGQCTSYATLLPPGRFVPNQAVVQIPQNTPPQVVQQILAQMGLTVLASQPLSSTGNTALNLQLPPGVSLRDVIRNLERNQVIAIAQANMKYALVQQAPAAATAPTRAAVQRGDPAQYMMGKLNLGEVHRAVTGSNITIAVVDSEVDREHAELAGTIAERFDATESEARAHSHGTAMAGAIVSRDRLLGVAPGARILAVRAFSETQATAESTTFTILKGIEWAVSQGARVINMSFAGPYDPSLERALKDAAAKGVILIAASGNAGPKSPPLWPGADPNVIAVTATDSGDKLFRLANRGPYVSVASPGVEILAPAPQAGYQMSTGTSIATAHVSGVVALMLERDPTLTPRDVRLILEATARDLGPKGRDTQYGWGLVNPARALAMVDERKRQRGSASTPVQR